MCTKYNSDVGLEVCYSTIYNNFFIYYCCTCILNIYGDSMVTTRGVLSLAGQPLHSERKGLVSCLYATCARCTVQCSPIRSLHVIFRLCHFNQIHSSKLPSVDNVNADMDS